MGHHSRVVALVALSALAVSGCFNSDQDRAIPSAIGESGFDLVSYTGTTRGTYIWPEGNSKRICAEPPPDLGLATAREISANLKAAATSLGAIASPSIDAGGAAKLSSAAFELAGRSQIVLLAREFLYRECELAANFDPESEQYQRLSEQYANVLQVVVTLADAERDRAAAERLEAEIAAEALERTQESKIDRIVVGVIKGDRTVDRDKLSKLLEKTQISQTIKDALLAESTPEGLRRVLDELSDKSTNAIFDALAS